MASKTTTRLWQGGVIAALSALLIEAALRLYPAAIPIDYLVRFHPEVRSAIASERGLPTQDMYRFVPRQDGGPRLRVYKPGITINQGYKDIGAVNPQTMDRHGFCNPDAPMGPVDILALGDSFTWCVAVGAADTWPIKLGGALGGTAYNMGIPAIGLYEHVQLLQWLGAVRAPKVVVLAVYEGNDFRDALIYWASREAQGLATSKEALAAERQETGGGLMAISYLANVVRAALGGGVAAGRSNQGGKVRGLVAGLNENIFFPDFGYQLHVGGADVAFNVGNGDLDEANHAVYLNRQPGALSAFDGALERFTLLAADLGFEPVVAYVPAAYTAYAGRLRFNDERLGPVMARFSTLQRDYFTAKARDLGYRFIDLTAPLQEKAAASTADTLLYFPINRHLTRHGHAAVAGALAAELGGR